MNKQTTEQEATKELDRLKKIIPKDGILDDSNLNVSYEPKKENKSKS